MSKLPLISIIVPVYNVEHFLPRCLDSIINQTYTNLEILCVNDGSPDNCGQILAEYAARDSRIKVIEQENRGLSAARNAALPFVTGQYILFVDSDDQIAPNTCELALNAALDQNADLVFWSYTRVYGEKKNDKHFFWDDYACFNEQDVQRFLHRRLCGLLGEELSHPDYANAFEPVWNKLYLASLILDRNILFVDTKEIGTEDALFNLYVFANVKKAVYLKKCLYYYTKTNGTSLTSLYKSNLFRQWNKLFDYMEDYITKNHFPDDFQQALQNRISLSVIGLGLNIVQADFRFDIKLNLIKEILNSPRFSRSLSTLDLRPMPLHWKIFFFCAKHRLSVVIYILLFCMRFAITH